VELDLRAIKQSLQMEMLRCQTPAMRFSRENSRNFGSQVNALRKEIWAHLLAYNLVRKVMAQAAMEAQLNPRQISFMGTVQTLNAFRDRCGAPRPTNSRGWQKFDTSGNVQERYIYDPYGSVTILAANWTTRGSSNYGWVFFHQGKRYDFA